MKKAFDTVWHESLFLKLQNAGINGNIYELIRSNYQHSMTDSIDIKEGVHQGNVLSPFLFNIFINDIGNTLSTDDTPIIHDSYINYLLYADDLVLFSTTEDWLQRNSDRVHEYCTNWGLVINTDKSKVMCVFFRNRSFG